jgi:ankyrin repeat protein
MEARPLPPRPNLEQYKKQAKDLLKACASRDTGAIHIWAERWFEAYADQCVETEARLRGLVVTQKLSESIQREQVDRIEENIRAGTLSKPRPKLADAQFFIAREHGFESWPRFVTQIQALQHGNSREANFEAAADAIISGDIQTLRQLLRDDPDLVRTRSQRTHHAPLLHYVGANGVEDFRQKTPDKIVEIAELLLDAGAEVDAESDAYGGGCTALGLVATSGHPERAGVQEALMQILLDHGAVIDKPGVAGNRHTTVEACLANGRGKAARFLASRGAVLNLETAAGAGRFDLVKGFFQEDGSLGPTAAKEQLQRGFLWACMYGRHEVVEFLLEHGADLRDQSDTGGTGLHWAAGGAHLSIVQLLIERGAPLEELNQWGGTVLEHAGWAFANGDPDRDYLPAFEALLAAGAKLQDGWLAWLKRQSGRSAAAKARISRVLRNYGAVT